MPIGKGAIKLALIISAAVVLIVIVVMSYLSGETVSIQDSLSALGLFIAGILTALGIRKGGAGVVALVFISGSLTACHVPAWHYARTTLSIAEHAMEATEDLIPADAPNREETLSLATTAFELGNRAVDVWESVETEEPPAIWRKAVGAMTLAASFVIDLLKTIGVPIPAPVNAAMSAVQLLATSV